MRELKFKAKRIDNGKWVVGSIIYNPENKYPVIGNIFSEYDNGRLIDFWNEIEVDEPSICQFVGLKDKNVFEGDKINIFMEGRIYQKMQDVEVFFNQGAFGVNRPIKNITSGKVIYDFVPFCNMDFSILDIEVIGNVHND